MQKVYSLDYLNQEFFNADIIKNDGKILYKTGDKITPEALLKLYFRDIYAKKPNVSEILDLPTENVTIEPSTTVQEHPAVAVKESKMAPVELENIQTLIEYKYETQSTAVRISKQAVKMGKIIGLPEEKLNNLEKAAYYCYSDDYKTHFEDKLISEEVLDIISDYDKYKLETKEDIYSLNSIIPYPHIISIASYYEKMMDKTNDKNNTIKTMLQIGGSRFNIFILHKFLKAQRDED